eukprot:scaffold323_cov414-Prasinococcus_capsulatus_cf.AAC.17
MSIGVASAAARPPSWRRKAAHDTSHHHHDDEMCRALPCAARPLSGLGFGEATLTRPIYRVRGLPPDEGVLREGQLIWSMSDVHIDQVYGGLGRLSSGGESGDATCSPSARSARHRARGTVWSAGRGGRMVVHGGEDGDGCGGGGGGVRLFSGCPMGPPSRVCVAGSLSADAGAARRCGGGADRPAIRATKPDAAPGAAPET